ncbi:dolichyl-phosphate mannose synthase [Serinibacter arcticus]|uniref:Dolichyl-phosphate mannose synthase n=1 Tax=Serinibacter arcticus TaxID=1655435 RepID=A0A4Z1DYQ4_9MICO|nr:dolichyl-phosphate mannose synthase [Serinibacter arcticus]
MWILIPAYEPDERLVALVTALQEAAEPPTGILVVDDGSGPAHRHLFDAVARRGVVVVPHAVNRGKGAALRTGVAWLLRQAPGEDLVCVDSDGQHRADDVAGVAQRLAVASAAGERCVVLGVRWFVGDVPWRSRFGNRASTALLALVTGQRVSDTQTGLRGYPAAVLPWLPTVPGDRFEYELRLLVDGPRAGVAVVEHEIATVYLEGNASSHFRPVRDSVRVMLPLLTFAASSLLSFALDAMLVLAITAATSNLLLAVVGARVVSGVANFLVNRRAVFHAHDRERGRSETLRQAGRYAALAVATLTASYLGVRVLTDAGLPLLEAKVLTDAALFAASFGLQRRVVFGGGPGPSTGSGAPVGSGVREDRDQEVGLRGERAQVPGAEQEVLAQPGRDDVGGQLVGRVAAARTESQDDATLRRQVRG